MGNIASSAAAGPGPPNTAVGKGGANSSSRSPKGRRSPKQRRGDKKRREITAEQLCNALREKGLCIAESDMKKVLAAHDNIAG